MNRDLRPVDPAVEREQLEWLAQISTRHERQLQELKSAEAQARREAQSLEWAAQVFPGCQAQQSNPFRSEFDADVREFADAITGRSTIQIGEAWDPAKHPRAGAPPNPGWWASTGGSGGAAHLAAWHPPVGHHWVSVGVTQHPDIRPFLSDEAVRYAAGAYSGTNRSPPR